MATKTYPYAVIWNGEVVPANTPIEVKEEVDTSEKAAKNRKKGGDSGEHRTNK